MYIHVHEQYMYTCTCRHSCNHFIPCNHCAIINQSISLSSVLSARLLITMHWMCFLCKTISLAFWSHSLHGRVAGGCCWQLLRAGHIHTAQEQAQGGPVQAPQTDRSHRTLLHIQTAAINNHLQVLMVHDIIASRTHCSREVTR